MIHRRLTWQTTLHRCNHYETSHLAVGVRPGQGGTSQLGLALSLSLPLTVSLARTWKPRVLEKKRAIKQVDCAADHFYQCIFAVETTFALSTKPLVSPSKAQ